jgi:putative ABC transport system substrate-binding protein
MKCPRCQHENEAGAKCCEESAAPIPRTCPSCGGQVTPSAKFCPHVRQSARVPLWPQAVRQAIRPRWWPHSLLAIVLLTSGLVGASIEAAQRAGPIRIGALTESWGPTPPMVGLRDGLIERGYREGEQFVIGVRFTQGDIAALSPAARELIQQGADVLFPTGVNAAKAARMATDRIPIVFAGAIGDPVDLGLVKSFAQPGSNITGVTDLDLELSPKRLEIFRELVPGLKRVLFAYDPSDAYAVAIAKGYREAARRLGIALIERTVRTEEEARALAQLRKGEFDGILGSSRISMNILGFLLEAASQQGIPTMVNDIFYVERAKALVSYGPDLYESGRQAARLVEKLLKGEDPARIPVETNPKIELAVNLAVTKALKLTIPSGIRLQVTRFVP